MFIKRNNEPDYALLNDVITKAQNIYGDNIDTVSDNDSRRNQSLNINDDHEIGENPNRYKQHGFYFNADNCIACHACEAACSEKNDNPAHISFRSVGFVEGGTYPAYQRLNISMACNHCDDPVCLKGCPTRAYTKFAEYGAVLQDPDICFGCGYCTWVCPYNAPQLDPVKGQVTKCNMCVDRLEVGLKPACVSACLGNALDFGVIENIPENRSQAKTEIPGFPRADITHPNIRFQQTRTPQRDMTRVDDSPLKYHKNETDGQFVPQVDHKDIQCKEWNWKKLFGSHENAHIAFTLSTQMIMGAFLILLSGLIPNSPMSAIINNSNLMITSLVIMWIIQSFGLFKLNMHLGKPHRFYRGFYNLRISPVSREIAGVTLFYMGLSGYLLGFILPIPFAELIKSISAAIATFGALAGGYYMYKLYRIKARPFWDHWNTATDFISTAMVWGTLLIGTISLFFGAMSVQTLELFSIILISGILLESLGLIAHSKDLKNANNEGSHSFYEQLSTYGNTYLFRNTLLALALAISVTIYFDILSTTLLWIALLSILVLSTAISRALFFVLVIPTTMPGAFFWRNKGFTEHAREVGLADMPQMGVVYERHHAFDLSALIETIKTTSINDKISQFKRIFTG